MRELMVLIHFQSIHIHIFITYQDWKMIVKTQKQIEINNKKIRK